MLQGRSRYVVSLFALLFIGCEKMPEYQVPVILEPQYTFVPPQNIPELNRHGYLMFSTIALSEKPLHKIYDEYRFHYAHFKCPIDDKFEVTGSLAANEFEDNPIIYENHHFKYDVSFTICPENDASKLECIYDFKQLKALPKELSCRVIFGRMFGQSAVIAENIKMDISQLEHAKLYVAPQLEKDE